MSRDGGAPVADARPPPGPEDPLPDPSAPSAAAGTDPLVGRLLEGRYRIGPRIARGGMASVYDAVDTRLDRRVAVKVMHPGLGGGEDDDSFAMRFVREARAAARLSDPNVVAVHDQGNDDGTLFLVMEHVQGSTLRDLIRARAPLGPSRALALLEPVVAALAAAHRAGIVHRDVKPENVLIADDGRIKVADFGLARAIDSETQHTATGGVLIGTVSYLAPELVVDGAADARADVYAAGVVLYELLTGRKPHEGETPIQVAYKHVHSDVPPPSDLTPGLPAYVDALVARATSRDRSQRPADAGVLLHHLHRVAHALAEGGGPDDDLVADLMPRRTGEDTVPETYDRAALLGEGFADAELYPLLADASGADDASGVIDLERPEPTDRTERTAVVAGAPPAPPTSAPRAPGGAADAATPRRRRRRGLRAAVVVLVLLLLGGLVGGGYWWAEGRYLTAPDVAGLDETSAVDRLEGRGLEVRVGEGAYSDHVPEGEVIGTDPEGGARVLPGSTITLTLSRGRELYEIPAMRGKTVPEAEAVFADMRLDYQGVREVYHDSVEEGVVLTSDPRPGQIVQPGDEIRLVVSAGRRPIELGDWVGEDASAARAALEEGDPDLDDDELRVEVREEFSDDVAAGVVISQAPDPGTTLYRGDTVALVVSKGPELVTIPTGLVRERVGEARRQLEALGLVVEEEPLGGDVPTLGFVFGVSPGGGERVRRGSTVTLSVL